MLRGTVFVKLYRPPRAGLGSSTGRAPLHRVMLGMGDSERSKSAEVIGRRPCVGLASVLEDC